MRRYKLLLRRPHSKRPVGRRLIGLGWLIEYGEGDFNELRRELPVLGLLGQVSRLQDLVNGKEAGRLLCRGTSHIRCLPKFAGCAMGQVRKSNSACGFLAAAWPIGNPPLS